MTTDNETMRDQDVFDAPEEAKASQDGAGRATGKATAAKPSFRERYGSKVLTFGILTVVAILLYIVVNMTEVKTFLLNVLGHTAPVIYGAIIAYLCDPILKFYEFKVFRRMKKGGARRGLSLFLTVLTVLAVLTMIILMMVPQLVESVTQLVTNYRDYLDKLLLFINGIVAKVTQNLPIDVDISSTDRLIDLLNEMYGSIDTFLAEKILPNLNAGVIAGTGWNVLVSVAKTFKDILLGFFIAFYILGSKEKRAAQINKFRRAVFTEEKNKKLGEFVGLVDKSFGGFIYGKLIDSLIVGVLTFLLLTILDVSPYNMLIATFIGVTNIIPVFGPFIGAIPSFLVVLISNPSKALLFIILVVIIQQLDGNVIGPKILGDNTGVSSLAVIIAITICGSLWSVPGMLVGVPVFAVAIELVKQVLEKRLAAKGEPTDTLAYYPADALGNAEQDLYYEHAGLRYRYEHGRIKPKIDRVTAAVANALGLGKRKKNTPTEGENANGSQDQEPHEDSQDGSGDGNALS
jgi:predicted PurR-regulated permease PerM